MRNETCRFDVIAMHQYELFLLRGRFYVLVVFGSAQGPINQGHAHGLALGIAKGQTVAARELRRLIFAADKLIDHFAFGHFNVPDCNLKAELFGFDPDLERTDSDFARKWMVATVAALCGITQSQ